MICFNFSYFALSIKLDGSKLEIFYGCELVYSNTGHFKTFVFLTFFCAFFLSFQIIFSKLNDEYKDFDLQSIRPTDSSLFKQVCQKSNFDMISINFDFDIDFNDCKQLIPAVIFFISNLIYSCDLFCNNQLEILFVILLTSLGSQAWDISQH